MFTCSQAVPYIREGSEFMVWGPEVFRGAYFFTYPQGAHFSHTPAGGPSFFYPPEGGPSFFFATFFPKKCLKHMFSSF